MVIVGYYSKVRAGKVILQDSSGEEPAFTANLETLFNFMLEPYEKDPCYKAQWGRYPTVIRLAWNLDEFLSPMLRLLGEAHCRELAETKETRWGDGGGPHC